MNIRITFFLIFCCCGLSPVFGQDHPSAYHGVFAGPTLHWETQLDVRSVMDYSVGYTRRRPLAWLEGLGYTTGARLMFLGSKYETTYEGRAVTATRNLDYALLSAAIDYNIAEGLAADLGPITDINLQLGIVFGLAINRTLKFKGEGVDAERELDYIGAFEAGSIIGTTVWFGRFGAGLEYFIGSDYEYDAFYSNHANRALTVSGQYRF